MKTCYTQAFGAAVFAARVLTLGRFKVMPLGAGAGVQQYADECEVNLRTGAPGGRGGCQRFIELGQAVNAAGFEMPPAAVVRDVQARVAGAGDFGHQRGGSGESAV